MGKNIKLSEAGKIMMMCVNDGEKGNQILEDFIVFPSLSHQILHSL